MSDKPLFDIVFTGDIAEGFALDDVQRKAAQLFKMDDKKVASLFQGKRLALKKNLDENAANKYRKVLSQIGMIVLVQSQSPSVPSPPTKEKVDDNQEVAKLTEKPITTLPNWDIDDVGVLLTEAQPEPEAEVIAPDYTLAPQPCDILKPEERPKVVPPPSLPALSSMTLGKVGEELLEISDKATTKEVDIDLSHLSTKATGELLLDDSEQKVVVKKEIDTSAIQFME